MKFFKQTIKGSCNVIAIQHVLSFFDEYLEFEQIKNDLPVHTFGSWLPEIGTYLENKGIKTKLISNAKSFTSASELFNKALDEYKLKGIFEDKIPTAQDIGTKPLIINVDAFKIRKQNGGPAAHYVVLIKENDSYYFYDGNNFDDKAITTFDEIYKTSLDINEFHENGMWLVLL